MSSSSSEIIQTEKPSVSSSNSSLITPIKVAIVGCGAVGLLYGGRLLEAELFQCAPLNVHFVLRQDYDYCSRKGFRILSEDGNVDFNPQQIKENLHNFEALLSSSLSHPLGRVDWIICALKSTAFNSEKSRSSIKAIVSKLADAETRVLVLMNGLLCEELFVEWFGGGRRVFGGMAFTCINRIRPPSFEDDDDDGDDSMVRQNQKEEGEKGEEGSPLVVHHLAHGAVQIGHWDDDPLELQIALSQLWAHSKIAHKVTTTPSLLRSRWLKLCWNIPFNGLAVSLGGVTTDVIVTDPDLRLIADDVMKDVIALANAHLRSVSEERGTALHSIDEADARRFCWHLADTIGAYRTSTVLDLIAGNPMELEYIFGKPLDIAMSLSDDTCSSGGGDSSNSSNSSELGGNDGAHLRSRWPERTRWAHLERLARTVFSISRIADMKGRKQEEWHPTLMN